MTPTPSTRTAKTHVLAQPPIIYWNRLLRYERITPMTGGDARVQTVVRALTLLERFSAEEPEHTATELSVATGLTVPTTHRLLKTLASKSFLVLDPESKKYSLGPAVVQLAGAVLGRDNLLELVDPVLIELRRASGETASLHWLVDNERVCIAERASHQSIRMSSGLGRRYTLHAGAAGKVLLASLPPAEMKSYLDRGYSANTIHTGRIELEEDLAAIRAKRYALSQGEVVKGAAAIAAPIRDSSGYPIAAINVTGPSDRWTRETMESFALQILSSVEAIEHQSGHADNV